MNMEVRLLGMSGVKMDQLNWGPVDGGTMSIVFVITTIITNMQQGPNAGLADNVESPTLPCLGRFCKAGKTGLAKSSSSFEVIHRFYSKIAKKNGFRKIAISTTRFVLP